MSHRCSALQRLLRLVPVGLVCLSGCAFLVDFESLERDCSTCVESQQCTPGPCTRNGCFPAPALNPDCAPAENEPKRCDGAAPGSLAHFADFTPLEGTVLQAEVLVTTTRIYQSVFIEAADGSTDVVIRAFDISSEAVPSGPLAPVTEVTVSALLQRKTDLVVAPGVLVAPRGNGRSDLTLFTAVAEPGSASGYVTRLDLDAALEPMGPLTDLTEFPNFDLDKDAGRAGPAAQVLETGEAFAVWQGCKPSTDTDINVLKDPCKTHGVAAGHGAIYGYSGETLSADVLVNGGIDEGLDASSIQAVAGGPAPAAIWTASALKGGSVVKAGVPSTQNVLELLQCEETGEPMQWLNASPIVGEVSSVAWTAGEGFVEATRIRCSDEECRDLLAVPDAGGSNSCSPELKRNRVVLDVEYVAHGVWALGNADENAHTVSAFVDLTGAERRLVASVTQGKPDPNSAPLLTRDGLWDLSADLPRRVALGMQPYSPETRRAVVAVSWIDRNSARLSALDLCLSP